LWQFGGNPEEKESGMIVPSRQASWGQNKMIFLHTERPVWTARRSPRASPGVAARGSLGFRPLLKSDKGGLRKPKEIDIKVTAA